jgi:hypothetical protein
MKVFLLALMTLLASTTHAQKDTTTVVASDGSVTWTVFVTEVGGTQFTITTIGRPAEGKQLSDVAGISIDNTYGVSVDPKTTKEKGNDGQISLVKKLYISKKDRYIITGTVSWYVKGENDVRKKNFRLVFTND